MVNLDFVLFSGNELPDDFVGSFIQQGQYYGEEKRFVQCVVAKPLLAGTITTTTKVVFQRVISNISESRINLARTKSRICDAQCVPIGAWFDNNQKTSPSSRPDRLQFCSNDCSFTAYASHQFLARFGLLDGDLIRIVSHGSRIIQLRYRIDIQDEFLHLERMLFWNIFAGTELECEAIEFKLYDIQNMDMLPTAKSVQLSIIASPYSTDKSYLALALDGLENALDRRFIYLNDLIEVRIGGI